MLESAAENDLSIKDQLDIEVEKTEVAIREILQKFHKDTGMIPYSNFI